MTNMIGHISKCVGIALKKGVPWETVMDAVGCGHVLRMPCGFIVEIRCIPIAGLATTPCPCGDSTHFLIEVTD